VHVGAKPVLDREIRCAPDQYRARCESEAASGCSARRRARRCRILKTRSAENARIDLKPFAANAARSIEAALANFRKSEQSVTSKPWSRAALAGIEYDSKTLRVIAERAAR